MGQLSKPRVSIKMNPQQTARLTGNIAELTAHFKDVAAVWSQLTPQQRDSLLAHSPVLARLVALCQMFEVR